MIIKISFLNIAQHWRARQHTFWGLLKNWFGPNSVRTFVFIYCKQNPLETLSPSNRLLRRIFKKYRLWIKYSRNLGLLPFTYACLLRNRVVGEIRKYYTSKNSDMSEKSSNHLIFFVKWMKTCLSANSRRAPTPQFN